VFAGLGQIKTQGLHLGKKKLNRKTGKPQNVKPSAFKYTITDSLYLTT